MNNWSTCLITIVVTGCIASVTATVIGGGSVRGSNWVNWTKDMSRISLDLIDINDNQEKDVAVGDLDLDGDLDVVIARKVPFSSPGGQQNILLMNEGGILVDRTVDLIPGFTIPDDSRDVLVFHANNDIWPDLVVANTFNGNPRLYISQGKDKNGVFLGFVEATNWFSPAFVPGAMFCAVYDGDVDNDGDKDLYFSDYNNSLEDRLFINDGNGQFTDETAARFPTGINQSVFGTGNFLCDFNLDGWVDIVKSSGTFEPLRLLINDGNGVFTNDQVLPSTSVYMVRTADFNNDGRPDLYVVSDGQDYQLINNSTNPDGTINVTQINVSSSNNTTGFGGNVKIADLDRDGFLDVGVADVDVDIPGCARRFTALRNKRPDTGNDSLFDPNNPVDLAWNSQGVHDIAWLDINGDGFWDMLQARCSGYEVYIMDPFVVPHGGADFNGDGSVNVIDILVVIAAWGPCENCPPACAGDADNNCTVDIHDLLIVIANWS